MLIRQYNWQTHAFVKEHRLSPELIRNLASWNGARPEQIIAWLALGDRVYTNLSYWEAAYPFKDNNGRVT